MIGYAIWDQTSLISNRFLRQYIRDTFFEINLDFGSIMIDHDLERIIEQAVATGFTHLVVFRSGHTARAPTKLRQSIEEFCQQDFVIAGHIIHHVNTYPFLHPQMFILNVDRYKTVGCPMIGFHEDSDLLELHKPARSPKNIHDDYTPVWLKPTGEIQATMRRDFGWNIIHESLQVGIPVLNLPNDVRWSKRYLYPDDRPHQFADCLQKLSRDELTVIPMKINPNQMSYMTELLNPGNACATFLFNTEMMLNHMPITEAKRILGLAAGFKLFLLWQKLGCSAEVVYFDHNHESLKKWKDIVHNWSGRDFPAFCKDRGYKDNFSKMQSVIETVGGEDRLEALWKRFRAINPKFIRCDLLSDPSTLIGEMADYGNVVWYSNCFKYFEGIRRYGIKGTDDKERSFLKALAERAKDTHCIGSNGCFLASNKIVM